MNTFISMLMAMAATISIASPPSDHYFVSDITDGDTLKATHLQSKKKINIRLACVDAPEKGQAGYEFSKQTLSKILGENQLIEIREKLKPDQYGRIISEVYYERDSKVFLLNVQLIEEGSLMFYEKYISNCKDNSQLYKEAEESAKKRGIGIWSPASFPPITPEFFRKIKPFLK